MHVVKVFEVLVAVKKADYQPEGILRVWVIVNFVRFEPIWKRKKGRESNSRPQACAS